MMNTTRIRSKIQRATFLKLGVSFKDSGENIISLAFIVSFSIIIEYIIHIPTLKKL